MVAYPQYRESQAHTTTVDNAIRQESGCTATGPAISGARSATHLMLEGRVGSLEEDRHVTAWLELGNWQARARIILLAWYMDGMAADQRRAIIWASGVTPAGVENRSPFLTPTHKHNLTPTLFLAYFFLL